MRKSITMKAGAVGTAFVLAGGLAVIASGTTGAYFSETKIGDIAGTIGNIHISTTDSLGDGNDHLNFKFGELLPGVAQTVSVNFKNTGTTPQDVYLTFPNGPALHALNNLGSYGEVHVVYNDNATLFESTNLSDNRPNSSGTCGVFKPTVGLTGQLPCWPLPDKLLVASGVAANGAGKVSFSFNYAAKLTGNGGTGGVFNTYPSPGAVGTDLASSGTGLPFDVVAVQVGQKP